MFGRTVRYLVIAGSGPFDPYKILGVNPSASKDEIKRAYHRLALRYHPDGGPEGNAERFAAVHEAYEAVKSGKWMPTERQNEKTSQGGPYGWDPKMRMYVYEKPGSTTEGYVSGHTETILKLLMLWCFCFVIVRVFLFWFFPNHARTDGNQEKKGMHTDDTLRQHVPSADHSTREDEGEFQWAVDMHRDIDAQPTDSDDPLVYRS